MKKLIFVVGLYLSIKAVVDAFRVIGHFSAYTFNTAYEAGYFTGQIVAPPLLLVAGVLLIRHSWSARASTSKQASQV